MIVDSSTQFILLVQEDAALWDTLTESVVNTMTELIHDPEWYELASSFLESAQMRECLPLHDVEGRRKQIESRVRANPFMLPEDIEQTI